MVLLAVSRSSMTMCSSALCAQPTPPSSSPTVAATVTSPRSSTPSSPSARSAATKVASPPFMSHEPRPYRRPSTTAPESGPWVQAAGSPFSTVSMCAFSRIPFPPPLPALMPITFGRFPNLVCMPTCP